MPDIAPAPAAKPAVVDFSKGPTGLAALNVPVKNTPPPKDPEVEIKVNDIDGEDISPTASTRQQAKSIQAKTTPIQHDSIDLNKTAPRGAEAPQDKKQEAAKDPTEVSLDIPGTEDKPAPAGARNYSEYPEELVPVLKALNNTQFAKHAPELKKIYELSKAPPPSKQVYEHPEAYRLDPAYNRTLQDSQLASFEQQHWSDALLKIKRGEQWNRLTGYDKDWNPQYVRVEPMKDGVVDSRAEIEVLNNMQQANAAVGSLGSQLNQIRSGYAQNGQNLLAQLEATELKVFPKLARKEDITPLDKRYMDYVENALPPQLRSDPLVGVLKKSSAMFGRVLGDLIKSREEVDKLKAQLEDRAAAPITLVNGGGRSAPNSKDEIEVALNQAYPD